MTDVPDAHNSGTGSELACLEFHAPAPRVYIIGEDHMRMQPLLEALDKLHVPTTVWNTSRGVLIPAMPPPPGVFFCRQSPSAASRGHATAVTYAGALLQWLELHGAMVLNGSRALAVETSKAAQMAILTSVGLNTPPTMLFQGLPQLATAAQLVAGAVIVKPNMGGSGKGIDSYASGAEASAVLRYAAREAVAAPGAAVVQAHAGAVAVDGLWVLQPLLGTYSTDPFDMKSIIRIEVVGGRVQRDYIVKITAPAKEFSLCPCDPRVAAVAGGIEFKILRNPLTIPGFVDNPVAFDVFCNKIEAAFERAGSVVGSVEAAVLADKHQEQARHFAVPHEPVLFDFNTCNTNYNNTAEQAAGIVPGVDRVAAMLQQALQWYVDNTASSAAGTASTTLTSVPL